MSAQEAKEKAEHCLLNGIEDTTDLESKIALLQLEISAKKCMNHAIFDGRLNPAVAEVLKGKGYVIVDLLDKDGYRYCEVGFDFAVFLII